MNRGITKKIREAIDAGDISGDFTTHDVSIALGEKDERPVANALSRMVRLEELKAFGTRYNRTFRSTENSTPHVLENLLEAMAEAEPVLRKAINIMKAVEDAK